jgi:Na+/proline symporter
MTGIIVIAVYTAIMLGCTVVFSKKAVTAGDFHTADRQLGLWQSAMSIAATWIWAPALFTSAEKAYSSGIPGLFWFLVPNVLCLLFFIPFAKRIRERMPEGVTLSDFMAKTYRSEKVRKIYLGQLSLLSVLSTGVQLLAGGKILSSITGIPFFWMTVILAVIAFSYSQFSGIKASVLTDAVQMILMLGACLLFVPWALSMEGGVSNLLHGLGGSAGSYTSLVDANGRAVLLSFGIPTAIGLIAGPFGDQCFWQRAFSIRKEKIGKAFALGALLFAAVPLSMGILGYIAAGSGAVITDAGLVNFQLIDAIFPKWVMVPFLFMVVSGLLSTVDSNLCAAASLTSDFGADLKTSKISMIVLLALGIGIANIPGLTVTHLFLFYCTLRATTFLPTAMTLSGKKLSANGVFFGVLASFVIGLPIFAYGNLAGLAVWKTVGSLVTVLLSGIVAYVLSRKEVSADARP